MIKGFLTGLVLLVSCSAMAEWRLDNEYSRVNFVSVKKGSVGEAHRFNQLNGTISDSGNLIFTIPLASVETMIPIRNERLQQMLFETKMFPEADVSAKIQPKYLQLANGQSIIATIKADLGLHGVNQLLDVEVMITRVSGSKLMVASLKPIILKPADFGLEKGVMALQEIAKLPDITQSVPVSFVLTFNNVITPAQD